MHVAMIYIIVAAHAFKCRFTVTEGADYLVAGLYRDHLAAAGLDGIQVRTSSGHFSSHVVARLPVILGQRANVVRMCFEVRDACHRCEEGLRHAVFFRASPATGGESNSIVSSAARSRVLST